MRNSFCISIGKPLLWLKIVVAVAVLRVVAFNHVIVVAAFCENETFLETKKESGRGKRLAQQVLPFSWEN